MDKREEIPKKKKYKKKDAMTFGAAHKQQTLPRGLLLFHLLLLLYLSNKIYLKLYSHNAEAPSWRWVRLRRVS